MPGAPDPMTETPNDAISRLLEDVIGSIHLTGSMIVRVEFSEPWAYTSPPGEKLVPLLGPGPENLILFHIIPEGRCTARLPDGESLELEAGDVVVFPYSDGHDVASPPDTRPVDLSGLLPRPPWPRLPEMRHGGGGARTVVVCGYLRGDDLLFNPFLRALPRMFRVRPPEGPTAEWLQASLRYAMAGAPPASAQRVHELIFVEVLRHHAASLPPAAMGWLAAIRDPVVGRALAHLHAAPAEPWTVAQLARKVAVSRSVLDDRFRRLLGRAPMRYLTEWRLQLASEFLRSSHHGMAEIASRVGYESEAAFSRAFRRLVGQPPARWRELQRMERR